MKPIELDVRPILRSGGEPFGTIMAAVGDLAPGQSLRLLAPFRPDPLLQVLARQGFASDPRQLENGDWEVTFSPVRGADDTTMPVDPAAPVTWPQPVGHVDCTGLPPQPRPAASWQPWTPCTRAKCCLRSPVVSPGRCSLNLKSEGTPGTDNWTSKATLIG